MNYRVIDKRVSYIDSLNEYNSLPLNKRKNIVLMDIGKVDDNGNWNAIERICTSKGKGIHNAVSAAFKAKFKKEPITYLFNYYTDSLGKDNEDKILIFPFKVSEKSYVEESQTIEVFKLENDNNEQSFSLQFDINEFFEGKNIVLDDVADDQMFEILQQYFTDYVAAEFNKAHNANVVKYVTIVLFVYKDPHNEDKYYFSHNAAIFSESLDFLENQQINFLLNYITTDKAYDEIVNLQQRLKQESTKSAKAAIMSRNMSHNIGSHVMSYLKQHLNSVKDIINNRVLSQLIEDGATFPITVTDDSKALPFLVGLGHFISYLQERQDFIATIATDYIPYFSTVNFKDFIYDELNPDKRAERHTEWASNLIMDNILLGNIARSEGLGRATRPTIRYENGTEQGSRLSDIVLKYGNKFNGSLPQESEAESELEAMRKINVSLPGGIVGRQAFFSIIENVIRNAAKHGNWRKQGKLELTFNIYTTSDIENENSIVPCNDNIEGCLSLKDTLSRFYKNAQGGEDLYFVTITDNCDFSLEALGKLRKALLDEYIDDANGIMRNGNKGLKEIKISSAWLRGIKDEKTCYCPYPENLRRDVDNINPALLECDEEWKANEGFAEAPIVYARISRSGGRRNLQYIICLVIPRMVALVYDQCNDFEPEQKKSLWSKNYWRVYSKEEFVNEKNKSFEFIVCDDSCYDKIRPIATSRVYKISQIKELKGNADINLYEYINSPEFNAKELELLLYKKLSGYVEGDFISVDDHTLKEKYEREARDESSDVIKIVIAEGDVPTIYKGADKNGEDKIYTNADLQKDLEQYRLSPGTYFKKGKVIVADGYSGGNFIYRRHHETIDQFANFMKRNPMFSGFVEGITGNNSTDRIVRNAIIDDVWFYRNLHAMKSQVAIFDERIFAKIMGLEETDFTKGNMIVATEKNIDEVKDTYKALEKGGDDSIIEFIYDAGVEELNNSYEELKNIFYKSSNKSKGILGMANIQKGIFVYTLIADINNNEKDKTHNKFYLIGAQFEERQIEGEYGCLCTTLAEFTYSEPEGLKVEFLKGGEYAKNKFDYITIHQGLLDKLYENFGIKGSERENDKKKELTAKLYKEFIKNLDTEDGMNKEFFPGLIVHSGRSKPSENDMPQKLPFIQYAALEHAVSDCKFSLVELLDFSRYEE